MIYSRWIAFVTHTPDGLLIQIFQWNIAPVSSGALNVFTISPASDTNVGFFYPLANEGKWSYAKGLVGLSDNWRFKKSTDGNYSRYGFLCFLPSPESAHSINVDGLDYVLDSNDPERVSCLCLSPKTSARP